MNKGKKIVNKAREFLGTPFHHMGRSKIAGVDCVGLILGVAQELGCVQYETKPYPEYPTAAERLIEILESKMDRVHSSDIENGDVLVFWISRHTKIPQHMAFKTDKGMIHTYAGVGRVVEHSFDKKWLRRLCGVFRFREDE